MNFCFNSVARHLPKSSCLFTFNKFYTQDVITPIKRYSYMLEKGLLKPDKSQFFAVLKLQDLFNDLKDYQYPKKKKKKNSQEKGMKIFLEVTK